MKNSAILLLLFCAFLKPISCSAQNEIFLCGGNIGFDDSVYQGKWWEYITIDTINYHNNIWQVGKPQKATFDSAYIYSLPNAIITDSLNPYPAYDTSVFILKLHGHSWGGWPLLSMGFGYLIDIDSTSYAKFEYSADSGATWTNLFDSNYTNYYIYSDTVLFGLHITNGTNGPVGTWHQVHINSYDPSQYINNDSMLFRFTFISGNVTTAHDGWMIDNFQIMYCPVGIPAIKEPMTKVWPNPCFNELNIECDEGLKSITIQNMLGQTILTKECSGTRFSISVSELPAGLYFLKINDVETRKFVKE